MADEFSRSYRKGDLIFEEGEDGHFACLLREGAVEIFQGHGADLVTIAEIAPGQIVGELSLVDGGRRMASARARVDSRIFLLDERIFKGKLGGLSADQRRSFARLIEFVRETLPHGVAAAGGKPAGDPVAIEEMGVFVEGVEFASAMARDDDKFLRTLADLLVFYAKRRLPPR
ncbi:MAG: cyclic nucleotide-binding domain-containing protein [Tagaea sp.]